MHSDATVEMLAVCSNTHPEPVRTNLDEGPYQELQEGQLINATFFADLSDEDVIDRYKPLVIKEYASRFPTVQGLAPDTWIGMLDKGQLARLCRAVADADSSLTDAIEDISFNPTSMGWDEPRNTRIHQKHCTLRDVVFDLQAELQELINAAWSI